MAAYKKTEAAIAKLSPEEYRVTQQSAIERPGTGEHRRLLTSVQHTLALTGNPLCPPSLTLKRLELSASEHSFA